MRALLLILALGCVGSAPAQELSTPAHDEMKGQWARMHGWGDWAPREQWDPDSSGYDAIHVAMTVEPGIIDESIDGQVLWTVVLGDPPPRELAFDFSDTLEVWQAEIDGHACRMTHDEDRLLLTLPVPGHAGDTLRARIAYRGIPERGFLWGFDVSYHNEIPVIYTNCEPIAARTWWPCKDRPDDKFLADLAFIVPDSLIAASNGTLVETIPLPDRRMLYHWQERYPITTYLVSLVATNFATFEDTYIAIDGTAMPITNYAYPEHLANAQAYWAFTPAAIAFYAETFGEYPFLEEKYGMAEYPWSGAMEHQTLSSMGSYFLTMSEPSDWVVVHELAHQWWGNWVTCGTWRDIWLNEGFAVYSEALWAEHLGGPDSLRTFMLSKASDHFSGPCYDPNFLFNAAVYRKGAWVMHMLRHVVGDALFFETLRLWGERHAYGCAVTADLQGIFEERWGHSLGWFFAQWVYGEGQPRYRVRWDPIAARADGETTVRIEVLQETTGPAYFKMPLDARFTLPGGEFFETVLWDSLSIQEFLVTLPAPPTRLEIDPMDWILGKVLYVASPSEAPPPPPEARLVLGNPVPNPASAYVRLDLSAGARPSADCRLLIYDTVGRLVRRLPISPGAESFLWDGRDVRGHAVSPGTYFARIGAGRGSPARRILIVR